MLVLVEFERSLAGAIAAWRGEHGAFANFIGFVANAEILKAAVLIALALAAALRSREPLIRARNGFLLRFFAAALTAIAAGRFLQMTLPHRDRPIVALTDWASRSAFGAESSFPSDHAVYMTALATAIFFADRKIGALAFAWTAIVILLPRVLLNYHYPTDILAGAAIGAVVASIFMTAPMPRAVLEGAAAAGDKAPTIVYPLLFLLAFEAGTNFETARAGMNALLRFF